MKDINLAYQMGVHEISKNGGDLKEIVLSLRKTFDLENADARLVASALIEFFLKYDGVTITRLSNEQLLKEYMNASRTLTEQGDFVACQCGTGLILKIPATPLIDTLRHEILRRMK